MSDEPLIKRGRKAPEKEEALDMAGEEEPDDQRVILVKVQGGEFECSKTLALHSAYFKRVLSSSSTDNNTKKEITLAGVSSTSFHMFLAICNGIGTVSDHSVEELLELAQKVEAEGLMEKCTEFLMTTSEKTPKEKFVLANRFRLEKLIIQVLSTANNIRELEAIVPFEDIGILHDITLTHVTQKSYSFHGIPNPSEDYVFQDMINHAIDTVEAEEERRNAGLHQRRALQEFIAREEQRARQALDMARILREMADLRQALLDRQAEQAVFPDVIPVRDRNQQNPAQAQNHLDQAQQPGHPAPPLRVVPMLPAPVPAQNQNGQAPNGIPDPMRWIVPREAQAAWAGRHVPMNQIAAHVAAQVRANRRPEDRRPIRVAVHVPVPAPIRDVPAPANPEVADDDEIIFLGQYRNQNPIENHVVVFERRAQ